MHDLTYSFFKICDLYRDKVGLCVSCVLVEPRLFLDHLTKQIRQQLFVIASLSEVLAETLFCGNMSTGPLLDGLKDSPSPESSLWTSFVH